MSQIFERLRVGLLTGGAVAVVMLLVAWGGLFTGVRLRLMNAYFVPIPTSGHVVLVAIDDATLEEYGRSLLSWSRVRYADLLAALSDDGARVVAFDLIFSEPAPGDFAFADAISAAREGGTRTILAAVGAQPTLDGVNFGESLLPTDELTASAANLGFVNATADPDGFVRRQYSTLTVQGEQRQPFSMATYLAYFNVSASMAPQVMQFTDDTLTLPPNLQIPLDSNGLWNQNYFGPSGEPFLIVSMRDVIEGDFAPGTFADKAVLVGLRNTFGAVDQYAAPPNARGRPMAGVEIQANALETLFSGVPVVRQGAGSRALMIIAVALAAGLMFSFVRWYWMVAVSILLGLAGFVVTSIIFSAQHLAVDMLDLFGTLGLTLGASVGVAAATELILRQQAEFLLRSVVEISEQRLELDRVLPTIADDIKRVVGARRGRIYLVDEDGVFDCRHEWGSSFDDARVLTMVTETQSAAIHNDALAVPVVWQGTLLAVFSAQMTVARRVNRTLLNALAQQIAPSLNNVQLYGYTQQQNTLLQGILSGSPGGVVVLEPDLTVLRYNLAAALALGLDPTDHLGKPLDSLLPDVDDDIRADVRAAFAAGARFHKEFDLRKKTFYFDAAPLADNSAWVVTLSDVSALAESNRVRTQMIRMASHDLKNPLGRILGYSEMLLEGDGDSELTPMNERFMQNIVNSGNEMLNIITEILNLEHLRAGQLEKVSVDMSAVVDKVAQRHTPDAESKAQALQTSVNGTPSTVLGDPNQITQAVSNLVSNAIKYTPEGGNIQLRLFPSNGCTRFEVEDNGYGMPADAQENLFTEFYRVRTAETANIKGTGLGLSLVKSIAEAHEGRVGFTSAEGVGSTFYLELPCEPSS